MPHFECGAIDHSATSPGAMTGGQPPVVGPSSRRGWRGRQGAGGEKFGAGEAVPFVMAGLDPAIHPLRKTLAKMMDTRVKPAYRTSRRVTLTDAAETYIQACRRILDEVDEAERVVSGEYRAPRGELTVTASLAFGRVHVTPVAAAFLKAYPDILLRLRLSDRVVSLQEEHIDVGIRIGALPDSGIVARRIGSVRRVVCASPDYLSSRGRPETPQDIAAHDCVTFTGFTHAESWEFQIGASTASVPIRARLQVDAAEAVVEAALAGTGIIRVFSYHVAEAVKEGRLSLLLEQFEPPPLPVNLVYLGGGLLPLKVRAFLDFAVPRLKARLAGDLA
jgi:DNA-binding transcriptional LysR family regulator